MRPIATEGTNARMVLPHEMDLPDDQRKGDLPIERVILETEELGEQRPGFESTWEPSDGERKALVNGAPIVLTLWGANHPPVNMRVGEPEGESMQALVSLKEAGAAAAGFFQRLSERMEEPGEIDPEEIPKMFEASLRETMRQPPPAPGSSNGNGA